MLSGVDLGDSVRVNIGSDNDLALFHTGSNGVIHNTTGELRIRANTLKLQDYSNEDLMIVANSNGSVDLYHNNVKKLETSAAGISVTGSIDATNHISLPDSKYLRLGDDADFIIYHDGSANYVQAIKQDSDIIFRGNDGGTNFNALTLDMSASGAATFNSNVTITGDLNLTGDINTTSVTNLDVVDKTITVAKGAANASAANGAGITVDGASASLTYNNTGDGWVFNKSLGIGSGSASYRLDVETSSSDIARFTRTGSSSYLWQISDAGTGAAQLWASAQTNDTGFLFRPKNSSGSNVNALFIAPDGQILMNLTGSDVGASTNILEASGNFRLQGGNRTIKFNNGSNEIVGIAQIASNKIQYGSGKLTIDVGNSKVGIGYNGPSSKLHVRGTASDTMTTANAFAAFDGTGGDGIIIGARSSSPFAAYIQSGYTPNIGTSHHYPLLLNPHGGNVGIGTSTAGVELDIKRTANSYPLRIGSEGGQGRAMVFADVASSASKYNWLIGAQYNIDNGFEITASTAVGGYTFNSPSIVFTNTGSVGIGTNTPDSKLDVNGVINIKSNPVIDSDGSSHYFKAPSNIYFYPGNTNTMYAATAGLMPSTDNARDLGSTSLRWRNVYTTDLHLSNEGSQNDVDGTSGNWTIQEGEEHLFIINNKNGKKYKFALEEIE